MRIVTVIGNRPQFIKAAGVFTPSSEAPRRADHPHRTALRRRPLAGLLRGARYPRSRIASSPSARDEHRADSPPARRLGSELHRGAGARAGLWGHELDASRRSLRRSAAHPGGPRRGGHALVRPAHAEELNRLLTDRVSSLLLCSTDTAMTNLAREAAPGERHLVGDVMADVDRGARDRGAPLQPSKTVSSNRATTCW